MTPAAFNTLFGTQATTATPNSKNSQSANNGSNAFGEVLSREVANQAPAPLAKNTQNTDLSNNKALSNKSTERSQQNNQLNTQRNVQVATNERLNNRRQEAQHDQVNRDNAAAAAAKESNGAPGTSSATTAAAPTNTKEKAASTDQDHKSATDETDQTEQAAAPSTASAQLLALVNSLAAKPGTTSGTTDTSVATDAAGTAAASALTNGSTDTTAGAITGAASNTDKTATDNATADPAFEAMLAHAHQSGQPRAAELSSTAGAEQSAATDTLLPKAPLQLNVATAGVAATDGAAARLVKADTTLNLNSLNAQVANAVEPALVSNLPGTSGIVATTLGPANGLPVTDTLAPRVGTTAWDNALGQKVVWMASGAQQSASLTLNPPDLGPVQVVINVSNASADATFTAAQPEVRQALEAALPRLKEMLSEAGISLGQTNINAGTPQQHTAQQQHPRSNSRDSGNDSRSSSDSESITRVRTQVITGGNGLVDTFA
jgi:flagellar hook-length control protein FliK